MRLQQCADAQRRSVVELSPHSSVRRNDAIATTVIDELTQANAQSGAAQMIQQLKRLVLRFASVSLPVLSCLLFVAPSTVLAADIDCVQQGGKTVCVKPIEGPWSIGLCDDNPPSLYFGAQWCIAKGGNWVNNNGNPGCVGASPDTEATIFPFSRAFSAAVTGNPIVSITASEWGSNVNAYQCYVGGSQYTHGYKTAEYKQLDLLNSAGGSERVIASRSRPSTVVCPPNTVVRLVAATDTYVCAVPLEKEKCPACGNPILADGGVKYQVENDGTFEGFSLDRTYMSRGSLNDPSLALTTFSFDRNWRSAFDYRLVVPSSGPLALMLPDTTIQHFTNPGDAILGTDKSGWKIKPVSAGIYAITTPDYTYVFGPTGSLTYVYTKSGRHLALSYSTTTTVAVDQSGNTLDGRTGANLLMSVVSDVGRTLTFDRDVQGRITRMKLPNSATPVTYFYSADLNASNQATYSVLTRVVYADGSGRTYLYNEAAYMSGISFPTALTGVQIDGGSGAPSSRYGYFSYDASGRAVATEHGNGIDKFTLNLSTPYQQTSATDPLGSLRNMTFVQVNGATAVASQSQPAGSGYTSSTSYTTYDANGNVANRDDFNGGRVCYTNDQARNIELVRVEGLSNATLCSAVTPVNATLPAGARKVSTGWHPDRSLEIVRAEPRKLTTTVYNGQPDPLSSNAIASCAPAAAVLPDGKPIAVVCKQVEQGTTDLDGHLGTSASVDASVTARTRSWTYNQYGKVLTATDPLNHVTTYAYYAATNANATLGDLQTVTNAAGQTTTYNQYDTMGQVLQSTDANGVVTTNSYDLQQRLLSTTTAGLTTSYTYDPVGLLLTTTLPNGTVITNTYDSARRLTQVTDSAGNQVIYALDNLGNRIGEQVKDPSGTLLRSITRSFDALGRLQNVAGAQR